jgi:hypothetical protein
MTAATIIDAADAIADCVLAVWGSKPLAVPNVAFDEKDLDASTDLWARLRIVHADGNQSTLVANEGHKRFERTGTVFVQMFSPRGKGLKGAYDEAETMLSAFEGKRTPNDVWFRRCRIEEIGESGSWYQINVVAEFTYEQRG